MARNFYANDFDSLMKLCTKNYETPSLFVKVTAKKLVASFFWTRCSRGHLPPKSDIEVSFDVRFLGKMTPKMKCLSGFRDGTPTRFGENRSRGLPNKKLGLSGSRPSQPPFWLAQWSSWQNSIERCPPCNKKLTNLVRMCCVLPDLFPKSQYNTDLQSTEKAIW